MTTFTVPQQEGELTPEEAVAWQKALINESNEAGNESKSTKALATVTGIMQERTEKMRDLWRRWRGIYYMLSGNTLEKGGPEDVHVPEIYKASETIIPRVVEQIMERQPWFRIAPRRKARREEAASNEALIDWQFSQAKVRDLLEPWIRDALFTQSGILHVWWERKETRRHKREIKRTFDSEGRLKRSVVVSDAKKVVDFYGPKCALVDPFDFIIETKATNPQDAMFVGHRAYMTIDQIRAYGKQRGWKNLDAIGKGKGTQKTVNPDQQLWSWPRDPAARYSSQFDQTKIQMDGRPEKLEVVFLYCKQTFDDGETYDDYFTVVVGGDTVVELRLNPLDGQYRPYAVIRSGKSGHEFYSTGVFDNAVRLNQHLDAYNQTFLAGARLAGAPMVFAEEDSDLPDTLYRVRPGQVLKGVGAVRMTQIPDGFLRAAPMVTGMLQKNIEETVGSFRINMGQDVGGTATEASLSLQEGNRRTRGFIRAVGDGLEQLLHIFHKMNLQFSVEDVEFPVLGKRALDLRKTVMNVGPADLLEDVEFELVGLHNTRNYGLKATGFQAVLSGAAPLIMANARSVDTLAMLHDLMSEMIGPEEADRYIKIPTPADQLRPQSEENEGLLNGVEIDVDPDDNHEEHLQELLPLWKRAADPSSDMNFHVRRCIAQHYLTHQQMMESQKVQQATIDQRQKAQQQMLPPEAGGQQSPETGRSSPMAGGMSAGMEDLSTGPPGQAEGENPGPASTGKGRRFGRGGGATVNQSDNTLRSA